jgi:HEAT repeat protein
MQRTRTVTWIIVAAVLPFGASSRAGSPSAPDEQLLRSAHLGTDGPALLEFFRLRTRAESRRERVPVLIKQLAASSADAADRAAGELAALGKVAVPLLQQAAMDTGQPGAARRARRCLEFIAGDGGTALAAAAARLLALQRPAGAVSVLLAYAPLAEDEAVAREVRTALGALALVNGKPEPILLASLADREPGRRATAAEALCQAGGVDPRPIVRKLLQDPDPAVRLRVALALLAVQEQEAVPVLIALLGDLPLYQARQAEEALTRLAGDQAPAVALGNEEAARQRCRDTWTAWWQGVDGSALRDYFRKRTLNETGREHVLALVRRLGDRVFRVRKKAAAELVLLKSVAVPFLKEALAHPDLEVRLQAERCLKRIQATPEAPRSASNVRLLALVRPAEAPALLLAYLPFADDDGVIDEVRTALASLAGFGGQPRQALLAALADQVAIRRMTAAEALCQARGTPPLAAVRKLLGDADPLVRLRVALALAARRDRQAVPVLIALLGELPQDQGWQAEEVLRRLADVRAPEAVLGTDEASRRKCRQAWQAWWRANEATVDLARLDGRQRLLGYTLVAQWNYRDRTNDLIELGPDRKPRWQISGLPYSFDFEVLPGNRLLVPEHLGGRVAERDFKGKVLWEFKIPAPVNCQRLPNGNTFIASHQELVEVTREGKVLYRINKQGIMAGQKMPGGQIAVLLSAGRCVRLDTRGKELKSFPIGQMNNYGGIEVLPRGRVIVSSFVQNKVVEYDADGKVVWQHAIPEPGFSTRLGNGNTLITSQGGKYAVEVTRAGKVVWEYRPGQAIWRARRR